MCKLLYGCSEHAAKLRAQTIDKGLLKGLRRNVPGIGGHGRVVAEFRYALELILTQKCVISSILCREITEIALRAASGDIDLEEIIKAQRVTVDPAIRTVFMSGTGLVRSVYDHMAIPDVHSSNCTHSNNCTSIQITSNWQGNSEPLSYKCLY